MYRFQAQWCFLQKKVVKQIYYISNIFSDNLSLKIVVVYMFRLLMKQFHSYGIHAREQIWSCFWVTLLSPWNMWHSTTNIKNVNNCNSSYSIESHRAKPAKKRENTLEEKLLTSIATYVYTSWPNARQNRRLSSIKDVKKVCLDSHPGGVYAFT